MNTESAVTDDAADYDEGRNVGLTPAAENLTELQIEALRQLQQNQERAFCLVSSSLKWIDGLANANNAKDVTLAHILTAAYDLLGDMKPLARVVQDQPLVQT